MSFHYYKVVREAEKPPCYGFRKADASEIANIVERVTRPTYSRLVLTEEPNQFHNFRYIREQSANRRSPSACKRRPLSGNVQQGNERRYNDWELQRMLRRVQRPTEASNFRYHSPVEDNTNVSKRNQRAKTADERSKALERLVRPTTASRAKSVTDCHLCDPEDLEKNKTLAPFEYEYGDDNEADAEVVDAIVKRVRSPTHASTRGRRMCLRSTPLIDEVKLRKGLPLVSGLARSTNVQEIVQRLHVKKSHGYRIKATPLYM